MSRRAIVILAITALLLLALFVPPYVTLNRLKVRLAGALGGAIGRPVTIGDVTLRLLPQPGFELTNFVVGDDPAFSAEPMLRADSVTASLRLTSLWRGRLEIATLSLENPSLNLVRNASGQWNLQALLRRATSTPLAPTGQRSPEARPRFPYIEASDGRISFKIGNEKKVWAIADADFALWLQSENEWRMRLEGRPVRTDLNLSDTGTLKVEGRFQRRPEAAESAVEFSGELSDSQLRELVRLISGADHGWAGKLTTDFTLAGPVSRLQLTADARLEDFRRYDIMGGEIMRFRARCSALYATGDETLENIACSLPVGDGKLTARGSIAHLFGARDFDLAFNADQVPANEVVALVRHAKKDMAGDLAAAGQVDGSIFLHGAGDALVYSGQGQGSALVLRSATLSVPLPLGNLKFGFLPASFLRRHPGKHRPEAAEAPRQNPFDIEPTDVPLGAAQPVILRAEATRDGYNIVLQGSAALPRLLEVARALGLRPPEVRARGNVRVNLEARTRWLGFRPPEFVGTLILNNVSADVTGLASPLVVSAATVTLSPDSVAASPLTLQLGGATAAGSVSLPRGCGHPSDCTVAFKLHADRLDVDAFNRLLNPRLQPHPWYQAMTGAPRVESVPARLRAEGDFTIERLIAKRLVAGNVAGHLAYANSQLAITALRGGILGGQSTDGTLRADFTADPPAYHLEGRLEKAAVQQIGEVMKDAWGTGTLSSRYGINFAGWSWAEMLGSAEGGAEFDWRNGVLRHVSLDAPGPLHFHRFSGILRLKDRKLTVASATLAAPHATYAVRGTAGFDRQVQFTFGTPAGGYTVQGLLAAPRVQALKSQPQSASRQP
jgi:hypothetical protein